jgi:hypothetical protein
MLKQMVRDVEYSFMLGVYNKPTDNTTKRQTRGILPAITTNVVGNSVSTVTGLSAATDTITETATALANGDKIVFTDTGASTAISTGRTYYVVQKATNTFKVVADLRWLGDHHRHRDRVLPQAVDHGDDPGHPVRRRSSRSTTTAASAAATAPCWSTPPRRSRSARPTPVPTASSTRPAAPSAVSRSTRS